MADFRALTVQSGTPTQIQDVNATVVGSGVKTLAGALTITGASDSIVLASHTTVASGKSLSSLGGASDLDWSASSGLTKTGTGAVSVNGDATLAAGKSISMAAGAGAADFSNGSGIFKTTTGAVTIGPGAVGVSGAATFSAAGTALTVTNNATISGILNAAVIDRAGTISIGGTNGTTVTIGRTGQSTVIAGDLTVNGDEHVIGNTIFDADATFKGDTTIGDGLGGPDTLDFDPTTGRLGSTTNPDIKWLKEQAHVLFVDDTTTADTAGAALTVRSGKGAGTAAGGAMGVAGGQGGATGAGGAVSVVGGLGGATSGAGGAASLAGGAAATSGTGGAASVTGGAGVGTDQNGGAVTVRGGAKTGAGVAGVLTMGDSNTSAINIGASGITSTITGNLTQLTGAISLTGNSASSISTSAGALTITSAAAATWATASGALSLSGFSGINLQVNGASILAGLAAALTVQAGVTLATTGSGNINLPNNGSARFKVEGTAVGATVTAPNLDTLTNGSNADALHVHAAAAAAAEVIQAGYDTTTNSVGDGDLGYLTTTANRVQKAIATSLAAARVFGANEGTAGSMTTHGTIGNQNVESTIVVAAGDELYLSASEAGKVTNVPPTTTGQVSLRVGYARTANGGAGNDVSMQLQIGISFLM